MHEFARAQQRVHRAERLDALRRHLIKIGHARKILIRIADLDIVPVRGLARGKVLADHVLHQVAHVGLDDEDHLRKARAQRIEHGIFHQDLAVRPDPVHLLAAAVARAHARRHNDQCRLHRRSSSCVEIFFIIAHLPSVFNFFSVEALFFGGKLLYCLRE